MDQTQSDTDPTGHPGGQQCFIFQKESAVLLLETHLIRFNGVSTDGFSLRRKITEERRLRPISYKRKRIDTSLPNLDETSSHRNSQYTTGPSELIKN